MTDQTAQTGQTAQADRAGGYGARAALAIGLIALAAVFAVFYRVENGREDHSYNSGGPPPANVALTVGKQYEISTPGGINTLTAKGIDPGALNCNYTQVGGVQTRQLDTTSLGSGTRTTHAVATFVAPVTGLVHVECRALPATYIDDADNVSGDPAGLFILLCTVSLSIGAMVGLSTLYRWGSARVGRGGKIGAADGPGEPDDYASLLAPPGEPPR